MFLKGLVWVVEVEWRRGAPAAVLGMALLWGFRDDGDSSWKSRKFAILFDDNCQCFRPDVRLLNDKFYERFYRFSYCVSDLMEMAALKSGDVVPVLEKRAALSCVFKTDEDVGD